jgi:iron complex transport system substrate-binding protein
VGKTARILGIGMAALVLFASLAGAKEIVDMYGRKLSMPDRARKVVSIGPTGTYLLYAIDPTMLAGLNFPVRKEQKRYLHGRMSRLPVIGWFGQGQAPNRETLMMIRPDVIFTSKLDQSLSAKVNEQMKVMKMPVVELTVDTLPEYPDAFLRAGRILGREGRARKLSDYGRKTLEEAGAVVGGIPREKRVTVYYAEGPDGLSTECDTSRHVELIRLAGGVNVHRCVSRNPYGLEKVSLEQVLMYDPEVILAFDAGFHRRVFKDPLWRNIRAVKTGRVYLIPSAPINWFDRPPSFMRFIGLKWVLNRLYPDHYRINMVKEARNFYRLFLGVEAPEGEMRRVVSGLP